MKREPTEWKKTGANDIPNKELISKIHKEFNNSTSKIKLT